MLNARNFRRNPNKFGCAHVLTPAGIAKKALLTGRYLKQKLGQYIALKEEIEKRVAGNSNTSLPKGSGV